MILWLIFVIGILTGYAIGMFLFASLPLNKYPTWLIKKLIRALVLILETRGIHTIVKEIKERKL